MKDPKVFKMNGVRLGEAQLYDNRQRDTLGTMLANAFAEHREMEIQQGNNRSIVLLLSPSDDLGHVYKINVDGSYKEIGITRK